MDNRSANLLGAFALALADAMRHATTEAGERAPSDAAALAVVHGSPGISIDTLAKTLRLTAAGASRLVGRMDGEGLVRRVPGTADARSRGLILTDEGEKAAAGVLEARRVAVGRAAAALSAEDTATLTRLVVTMLDAMTPDRWAAEHSCRLCDLDACPQDDCPIEQAARRTER